MGKKIIHSMRIIHLEDSVDKHMEVCRELRKMGITSVEWATSVGEGLEKIETAIQNGARHLIWQFPICTTRSGEVRLPIGRLESIFSRLWPRETSTYPLSSAPPGITAYRAHTAASGSLTCQIGKWSYAV